jgi:FHA domain
MGLILEIKSGPFLGRTMPIRAGESLSVGRAPDRAQFAVPHDNQMSGVHFAVECGPNGCRVIDKKSSNGTFLSGARIQESMLATGDEIRSGQTVFVVRIVRDDQLPAAGPEAVGQSQDAGSPNVRAMGQSPAPVRMEVPTPASTPTRAPVRPPAVPPQFPARLPKRAHERPEAPAPSSAVQDRPAQRPAAPMPKPKEPISVSPGRPGQSPVLAVGSWAFYKIPQGWQIQEGLGIQQDVKDAFPASIGAMEEPLGPGITLPQYVEAQTKMFREYLREPKIDAAVPPNIPGSVETVALEVRYSTKDGQSIYYHRVYARSGSTVGVLTLTTLDKDLSSVRPAYDSVLAAVNFSRQD